jgi:adenine-specific DNA-methyltransferase
MRGYVPTPPAVVDLMVARLFQGMRPSPEARVLDPGCGDGAFIEGILRWCRRHGCPPPQIVGVELHPGRSDEARRWFADVESVRIERQDFLRADLQPFDFVVGNPPYVAITSMSESEKAWYRHAFETATGRFDLYVLFWEKALRLLKPGGRMVFITPEKFMTVESARPLRRLLARHAVPDIELLDEDTFPGLTTYPTVTTVERRPNGRPTRITMRDGKTRAVLLTPDGSSLAAGMYGDGYTAETPLTLGAVCRRISCGVATGADRHFILPTNGLEHDLRVHAFPTVSGRQLVPGSDEIRLVDSMLIPYDRSGRLLDFDQLTDGFATHLEARREDLLTRTCAHRKPWYAFHETPPLDDLLRPKLLCKDVTESPHFWMDAEGAIVPRHSVYYLVPRDPGVLLDLASYLNGPEARAWLEAHCQRVRRGFLRLQSTVLKQVPVPVEFMPPDLHPLLAATLP